MTPRELGFFPKINRASKILRFSNILHIPPTLQLSTLYVLSSGRIVRRGQDAENLLGKLEKLLGKMCSPFYNLLEMPLPQVSTEEPILRLLLSLVSKFESKILTPPFKKHFLGYVWDTFR